MRVCFFVSFLLNFIVNVLTVGNPTQQVLALTQELRCARDEEDALLSAQRSSAEETEKLLSSVASLAAERDQLQTDMQDNVDMVGPRLKMQFFCPYIS